jgi:hypothetical protein
MELKINCWYQANYTQNPRLSLDECYGDFAPVMTSEAQFLFEDG